MLCGDCHRWPGYPAVLSALDGPAQAMSASRLPQADHPLRCRMNRHAYDRIMAKDL
jgi:hypothetical protein